MEFYYIQESTDKNCWIDLYTSDLCMLKKMILILKNKSPNKFYRIIKVFRWNLFLVIL